MHWGAALIAVSWITLSHGPAAGRCTDIGELSLPLWLHPSNDQMLSLVCPISIGFSDLDPFCDLLFSPQERQLLAREILAGGEGATLALTELTGQPGPFPFVQLSPDPSDATDDGSAGSVSLVLSDQQEALLGCGPFYGTCCEDDGIDLLYAEASALFQSLGLFDPPACQRLVDGELVILPGCRGPDDDEYDPTIDGTPPSQPHPVDGSAFSIEIAALSWNFLVYLVASSDLDPGDPYAPDRCSFANPNVCSAVKGITSGLEGRPRVRFFVKIGRNRFTFKAKKHDGIALNGDPATLGASLRVWSLDSAGGSTGTIDLDPSKWKALRKNGEVVGYRYRDRTRSRGGVSKVVLKNGHLEIHARGRAWPRQPIGAPGEVWVHFSVGGQGWCGAFADDRLAL